MINIRAGLIAITICLVIALINDAPKPVKDNQVPFCVIDEKAAFKDQFGQWHTGWSKGFGPCSLQDIYREI